MPYFDHNATTPATEDVVAALLPFLRERFGNPSSAHALGEDAADAVRSARTSVARLLGADADEIVFTSGGTESNNIALHAACAEHTSRDRIVTCASEHSSVLDCCEELARRGARLTTLPVDREGRLDVDAACAALDERCAIVSLMLANNETGVVHDLAPIARRARELGVLVHADLVQAAGKMPLDVRALGVDLATVTAHKIHGPKGVGALYVRRGVVPAPLVFGGSQERRIRPGTENVPGIVGFGRAALNARGFAADPTGPARLAALRDRFETGVLERVVDARVNCRAAPRVPNTTSICFHGLDAETLLQAFTSRGLHASAGSACHAQARKPSHVLLALGLDLREARSSVRFSLGRDTTAAEVEEALEIVTECAALAALERGT